MVSPGLEQDAPGRELGWGWSCVDPEARPRCLQIPEPTQSVGMGGKETGAEWVRPGTTARQPMPRTGKNSALTFLGDPNFQDLDRGWGSPCCPVAVPTLTRRGAGGLALSPNA